jgi:hypothetical protein
MMEKLLAFYENSEHPFFPQPAPSAKLWRYMSLAKLVSLLDKRCLYFARSDQLGDPFEGSWARNQPMRDYPSAGTKSEVAAERRRLDWNQRRESTAINCWHLGESESAAMWNQYGDAGIAIQTTFAGLTGALPQKPGDATGWNRIFVGLVKYIDYESDSVPEGILFWPFMHKRQSFSHEREVRAVIHRMGDGMHEYKELEMTLRNPGFQTDGIDVPVDLDLLIGRVYVSPASPRWFADAVRSVMVRFGIQAEVNHSALDASPIY